MICHILGGVELDPIAEELLGTVRKELGYREKSGEHTKFGHWYADRVQDPQYRDAPWCDMFIAWAADKAGIADYVGQFAWTPSHAVWFIKQDAWTQQPEPGALVFFDWKGGKSYKGVDHVGIVERVEGKKIHTIEANVDRVWLKRKTRETDKVVGYGLPRVVKANATLGEIRSTEQPFPLGERADRPQSSPLDVLGTPLALLAVMVVTTVVVSLRLAGRGRGHHRRFRWPWNAPSDPPPGKTAEAPPPMGPRVSPPVPRARSGSPKPASATRESGSVATKTRVPVGTGRTPARRRPYEPKG
ncbi:CHAP domain-containing protein [Nonomuraea sp. LPB2021202275-12-8]|uniref:CHAP domain-containing protein n=1 Tax=Nonomuraea sp. LPB2021202275-12-8 TaxID=3120159 RepID=UPI00300D8684